MMTRAILAATAILNCYMVISGNLIAPMALHVGFAIGAMYAQIVLDFGQLFRKTEG